MPKGIMYLESMPVSSDKEAEYHKWYNDTHLAELTKIDGSCRPAGSRRPTARDRSSRSTSWTATTWTRWCERMGEFAATGQMSSLEYLSLDHTARAQDLPRDRVVRAVSRESADFLKRIYALMVLMKAADDRLSKGIGTGEFMCVYWPSRGQEAIAAAMGVCLRADDQLVTTYRGLHDLIGKGVPLEEIYGEMMGAHRGASRGKGGTMHIAKPEKGVMLSTGHRRRRAAGRRRARHGRATQRPRPRHRGQLR